MLYYSPHTECLGIGIYHELKVILEYEKDSNSPYVSLLNGPTLQEK